jgi:glutamate N-acetyltransferase/amino-acid N-acetyltransferase
MVEALRGISDANRGPVDVAEAIMTTDRYPKVAWKRSNGVTCLGVAKGAGMIEPNLATMLGFIMCDARVDRDRLDRVFRRVVDQTFNTISIDGDQSTSDMVLCIANGASGTEVSDTELEALLMPVCRSLAQDIVRNGEGTAHVMEIRVRGVNDYLLSQRIGRHVANSPLVKTAIFGNDPNVGRILAAVGDALDTWDTNHAVDADELTVTIAGRDVYREGSFRLDGTVERELAEFLQRAAMDPEISGYPQETPTVPIVLSFGAFDNETVVYGSDLSYEYVRENADYRT